jgi:hypothetical protein
MNTTLAILKLASKFSNGKDCRAYCNNVQVLKDYSVEKATFLSTNGHIAIKITSELYGLGVLPEQVTIESITKAYKVNEKNLLDKGEYEVRFPDFNKIFTRSEHYQLDNATFDCKYLSLIFQSIEAFRKDLKVKEARVNFQPLANDKANLMTVVFNPGLSTEIKIDIAIMPLKN